jgi:hypothetical protein
MKDTVEKRIACNPESVWASACYPQTSDTLNAVLNEVLEATLAPAQGQNPVRESVTMA